MERIQRIESIPEIEEVENLKRLINKANGDGFDYVDLSLEDAKILLNKIIYIQAESANYHNFAAEGFDKISDLKAKNKRLREALKEIADGGEPHEIIAEEALREGEKG